MPLKVLYTNNASKEVLSCCLFADDGADYSPLEGRDVHCCCSPCWDSGRLEGGHIGEEGLQGGRYQTDSIREGSDVRVAPD